MTTSTNGVDFLITAAVLYPILNVHNIGHKARWWALIRKSLFERLKEHEAVTIHLDIAQTNFWTDCLSQEKLQRATRSVFFGVR